MGEVGNSANLLSSGISYNWVMDCCIKNSRTTRESPPFWSYWSLRVCKMKYVIEKAHRGEFGGHLGEEKTKSRIKERFYWPGVKMVSIMSTLCN